MAQSSYTYTGTQTLVYPAYCSVGSDGQVSTLVGVPGIECVIQRAGGNQQLPDVPGDGLWVPTVAAPADKPETPTKPPKEVS